TSIGGIIDLTVTSSHSGSFVQGATGRIYRLSVRNAGRNASSGTVSVTDTLPPGLTATAISGTGWACDVPTLTSTRSDVLAGSAIYPTITLIVNVSPSAASAVVNTATVSGGGEVITGNDTATDPTTIWSAATCGSFGAPVKYTTGGTGTFGITTADL